MCTHIYQWESITETFYFEGHAEYQAINFFPPTVPQLLKRPRPHQVKQTQDESYINHYSFYCTVCSEFMFMTRWPVLCASEIGNIKEVSFIDISLLHKCSWMHIMPKAVSFFFFSTFKSDFLFISVPHCCSVGVILYDVKDRAPSKLQTKHLWLFHT